MLQRTRDNIFFIIPFARRRRYLQQPRPFSADYYYLLRLIHVLYAFDMYYNTLNVNINYDCVIVISCTIFLHDDKFFILVVTRRRFPDKQSDLGSRNRMDDDDLSVCCVLLLHFFLS